MKPNAILLSIPETEGWYESVTIYSSRFYLADDPAHQILQIFNFSAFTEQLQACAYLFGICHRIIAGSWNIQGKCAGHLAHIAVQSLGYSRL